ncbi:hypothetical protein [Halomontanus rarus]|uniref:hypothetical protein n=1 Tax=Halomontanus rarus TaxID=3034020 RepID=UPI00293BA109|nr:hypothetical protein [Halovivax sp. KZCA124]
MDDGIDFDVEDGKIVDSEARFSGLYPADSVPSEDEIRDHLFGNLVDDVPHDLVIDDCRVYASVTFEEPPDQPR